MVKAVAPTPRARRQRRRPITVDNAATLALEPLLAPFIVLVDQQEKTPWTFAGITVKTATGLRRVHVRCETCHLKTGDYSIRGYEGSIVIERKSMTDIFGTVGAGRERFRREHERMKAIVDAGGQAHVVIESCKAEWDATPPDRSEVSPDAVTGTMISWQRRFGVQWHMAGSRPAGEDLAWIILNNFWVGLKRESRELQKREAALTAMSELWK